MFQPHHSSLPSKPIAWALLSQTVWLPLIAIDLHDRWKAELHDQQQIAVAASGSSNSSILQTKSNQANTLGAASPGSVQTIGPERSSRATHTGLLLGSSSRALQGLDGHSESYTEAGSTPANPSDSRHLPRSQARSTWVGTATDHATPLVNQRSGRSSSTVESHTQAELTRSSSSDESIPSYGFDSGWRSRYNRAELLGGSLSIHDPNGAAAMPPLAMAERAR